MNRLELTPVVKQILIGCVVLFLGSILLLSNKQIDLNGILGMHYPANARFAPWQIITHMFMHDNTGFTHILFNMFGLVTFGVVLEKVFGSKKFLYLYFLSGLGALFVHLLVDSITVYSITGSYFLTDEVFNTYVINNNLADVWQNVIIRSKEGYSISDIKESSPSAKSLIELSGIYNSSMVGASGALYGVLAAFVLLFPNTSLYIMFIPIPIKAKFVIPGFILLDLYLGISKYNWDPIAHFAHIGGAIFGLLITLYWRKFDKRNFW